MSFEGEERRGRNSWMRLNPSALRGCEEDPKRGVSTQAVQKALKGARSVIGADEGEEGGGKYASQKSCQTKCGAWPGAGAEAPLEVLTAFEPCEGPAEDESREEEEESEPLRALARVERDERARSEPEGKVGARRAA